MRTVRGFNSRRATKGGAVALGCAVALLVAGCGGSKNDNGNTGNAQNSGQNSGSAAAPGGTGGGGGTLTIDTSFIVTTLDPSRAVTPTMTIATRGIYDTLLRTEGADTKPVPSIAESFEASADAKTFTFKLRKDVTFADGAKLTSADVLFTLRRLANLKLGGSYLMEGITPTAPDANTVVLKSEAPNPAIPVIVTTPAFAILNSELVKKNGGTDADNAADADKADTWFNSASAGGGPYVLESFKTNDSITLVRNEKYWGATKPHFDRVVIRNMPAATQLLNVQRGANEIAIDLSASQSAPLKNDPKVTVSTTPSSSLFRLQANMDPAASAVSSNEKIQEAIRYGLNYEAMVQLGGEGSIQAAGLIPSTVQGALPPAEAVKTDVEKAKAAVAASGIASPSMTLTYPSDINVNGVQFATFAQRVQADLQAVGITTKLEALPVATYLPKWREGKMELTLTYSYPDFMDPTSFTGYLPGGSDAVRAGWKEGANPDLEALGKEMASTVDSAARAKLAEELQRKLNATGPYSPMIQTAQTIVGSSNLSGLVLNPGWTLDVAAIGSK